jgi:CheY-like chemotaxis protein
VLVVDDEPTVRSVCAALLANWGYAVTEAHDGQDALEKLAEITVDAVLLDVNMPRLRGDLLLARLREERPCLPVVIMSSDGQEVQARVLHLGATSFLTKPFGAAQLRDHITRALPQQ